MKLVPLDSGGLRLLLDYDEAAMLHQLITQLTNLMHSHSGGEPDPDPLFASLEIGGSEELPGDPALARLFPDAYEGNADAAQFRRVTEQGLLNRKLQDATEVTAALGFDGEAGVDPAATDPTATDPAASPEPIAVEITSETLPAWVRTVTALRLAIAARIGLERPEDHDRLMADQEMRGTVLVFDWLAAILEALITIVAAPGDSE